MVSDDFKLNINVDTLYAMRTLAELQRRADEVGADVVTLRKTANEEFIKIARKGRRIVSGIRTMMYGFIGTLDPMFDAFLTTVYTALESVLVTHRILEAGTGGLAATFTVGLSMAATSIAIINLMNIATLKEDSMEAMNRSLAIVSGLEMMFQP